MSKQNYSLSEAFRLAEAVEKNGLEFYTLAAATVKDKKTKEILLNLAEQEQRHAELFAQMRQEYCAREDLHVVDADDQVLNYIQSVAATHVFNLDKNVARLVASVQSPQSTLQLALSFEKDTITFFSALKNGVQHEHRDKVEQLIQEEVRHVRDLQEAMKNL
ncbi:MAG: ferritin family protein [Sedimentisphaerales bacterium]|nr:ferritin family protein [Sedimentisphaerales bacterium]